MPRGPKGEKRPADVIGNAVKVMRIATGEIEDEGRDPAGRLPGQQVADFARALEKAICKISGYRSCEIDTAHEDYAPRPCPVTSVRFGSI